jgi:hypothetical protein
MSHQIERIQNLLCQKGISSDLKEGGTELMTFISTGPIGSRLAIEERQNVLRCFVLFPIYCPVYRRTEMALAISRANWGLIGGSFRMDQEDGEVRYECFLPVLDGVVTEDQITWLVWGSWHTASRYALAFTEIAVSAANAEEAINRADATYQEEARARLTA